MDMTRREYRALLAAEMEAIQLEALSRGQIVDDTSARAQADPWASDRDVQRHAAQERRAQAVARGTL